MAGKNQNGMAGLSPEQQAELDAMTREIEGIKSDLVSPAPKTPEQLLNEKKLELLELKEEARKKAQKAEDDAAYAKAVFEYGKSKVGCIQTAQGLVLLRAASDKEQKSYELSFTQSPSKEDKERISIRHAKSILLHPSEERFDQIRNEYPLFINVFFDTYIDLMRGNAEANQKKD